MIYNLLAGIMSQDEVLNQLNAHVWYKHLPENVYGFVFNDEGLNCIVINYALSTYRKKKVILHELAHIELNHLGQANKDLFEFYIDDREDEADIYVKLIKKRIKELNTIMEKEV